MNDDEDQAKERVNADQVQHVFGPDQQSEDQLQDAGDPHQHLDNRQSHFHTYHHRD